MFGQTIGIEISGRTQKKGLWSFDCAYTHRHGGKAPNPSRMVWLMGWRRGINSCGWSVMIQIYRPGTELDWHTDDNRTSNRIWSWVFWKPRKGGDLEIEGLHHKWWRFYSFDGGTQRHRVTRCDGYRGVIMFQRISMLN